MSTITCRGCGATYKGITLPDHGCDGSAFGTLGQDVENFEKRRVLGLDYPVVPEPVEAFERQSDIAAMASQRGPARARAIAAGQRDPVSETTRQQYWPTAEEQERQKNQEATERTAAVALQPHGVMQMVRDNPARVGATMGDLAEQRAADQAETREMVRAVVSELTRGLGQAMETLRQDIVAQNDLMRHMDVPMEAIADSHERATASFETLRKDIFAGGLDKLEKVLDVSGLSKQASKSEQRIEALVKRLEEKIDKAFKAHADDMVAILKLLERLQARELRETKNRIQRAARSAVRRGPKV